MEVRALPPGLRPLPVAPLLSKEEEMLPLGLRPLAPANEMLPLGLRPVGAPAGLFGFPAAVDAEATLLPPESLLGLLGAKPSGPPMLTLELKKVGPPNDGSWLGALLESGVQRGGAEEEDEEG